VRDLEGGADGYPKPGMAHTLNRRYTRARQRMPRCYVPISLAPLLPVWLTIGVMPLIYVVGLWSAYEQAFVRIGFATDDPASWRRAKRALMGAAKWRAADVGGFAGHWIHDLADAESSEAARVVMQRFRASWRSERHAERMSNARANLDLWLDESDETLAEIHWDALRRSWERLNPNQRATLRDEASRLSRGNDALRTLPD
jgi:hypothetical protein